jgi:hypothetical protein
LEESLRTTFIAVLIAGTAAQAAAQERPFLFSISTATEQKPAVRFDYDIGVGERAFQSDVANQPEQRVGVQASYRRLTLLARVGIAEVGSAYQSSQSWEVLYSLLGPSRRTSLAAGGGMLHEPDGVNVWLGRIVAGRNADTWLVHGNLLFQKPIATDRDAVDLITSVGWAHKLPHGMSLGAEAIGEDLEGFWEAEEAEGGARLLVGPSFHVSPTGRRWQFIATGGPLFHPSDTGRSSDAFRDLPPETKHTSYAFKASLSISIVSGR